MLFVPLRTWFVVSSDLIEYFLCKLNEALIKELDVIKFRSFKLVGKNILLF
jgi:hypothetical protein